MITCANCQSSQFLQITSSRLVFEDLDDPSTLKEIEECYECTWCGGEGEFIYQDGQGSISGDVEEVSDPVVHL